MENAEEIYNFLEDFTKRKPKVIPQELNDYLSYVARTGDPVYQWSLVKCLFKEKLLNVITDFYEATPVLEIPPYPNVDPFNYDTMKNSLLERLDSFNSAPFTVQRICELLTFPRKQYNRIDKFMRAIEKNILVVSTREPGVQRPAELDNGELEPAEPIVNGSDNSEYNVDVEMEDVSWKENTEQNHITEPQPSSSDTLISVDDIETRLQAKETVSEPQDKSTTEYESVTPPELNVSPDEAEMKTEDEVPHPVTADVEPMKETEISELPETSEIQEATDPLGPDTKADEGIKTEVEVKEIESVVVPEIKVDDTEMTIPEIKVDDAKITIPEIKVDDTEMKIPEIKVDDAEMTEKRLIEELYSDVDDISNVDDKQYTKIDELHTVIDEQDANINEQNVKKDEQIANIDEQSANIEEQNANIDEQNANIDDKEGNIENLDNAGGDMVEKIDEDAEEKDVAATEPKDEIQPTISDESSSDSNLKEDPPKTISEISTSSEESCSSSDITDGNSNSPKIEIDEAPQEINEAPQKINEVPHEINEVPQEMDEVPQEIPEVSTAEVIPELEISKPEVAEPINPIIEAENEITEPSPSPEETVAESLKEEKETETPQVKTENASTMDPPIMQSDNYSVADVNSVIPEPMEVKAEENVPEVKVGVLVDIEEPMQEMKAEEIDSKEA